MRAATSVLVGFEAGLMAAKSTPPARRPSRRGSFEPERLDPTDGYRASGEGSEPGISSVSRRGDLPMRFAASWILIRLVVPLLDEPARGIGAGVGDIRRPGGGIAPDHVHVNDTRHFDVRLLDAKQNVRRDFLVGAAVLAPPAIGQGNERVDDEKPDGERRRLPGITQYERRTRESKLVVSRELVPRES